MARRRFEVAPVYYDTDGTFNTALLGATFSPPFAIPVNVRQPDVPSSLV